MVSDYRLSENRKTYFDKLYNLNLQTGIMPGLVYLYMPALAQKYGWNNEQKLWFAFLNGMTQNPITSLRMFNQLPECPPAGATLSKFDAWFNLDWERLQFDVDRRYQKRDTLESIKTYAKLVDEHGSQEEMLTEKSYSELWKLVRNSYYSFGRLSSFSYLEYVHLNGFGAECDDLVFGDKDGSKSHRNGMMFLFGYDHMVWDKRADNGFDGSYDMQKIVPWLNDQAMRYLDEFKTKHPHKNIGMFTLESNLCTFKNHFFGRRYPGVYADMAWERIEWAESRGVDCKVFREMREEHLPEWLRWECESKPMTLKEKAAIFPKTGFPFRGEYFL